MAESDRRHSGTDKQRPAKQRHTAKRIFERLKDEHGFTGGQFEGTSIGSLCRIQEGESAHSCQNERNERQELISGRRL